MKRARQIKGIGQRNAAALLGVGHFTYMKWEKDQATPYPRYYPSIIAFVGYPPFPRPKTEGDELRYARLASGMTAQQAADECGVDESTWLSFERESRATLSETRRRLQEWSQSSQS